MSEPTKPGDKPAADHLHGQNAETRGSIDQYYERYWELPEEYDDPTTAQRQALWTRHVTTLPKGARVLDVGCGRGEFCAFFASLGLTPMGTDISSQAVEFARRQHPQIPFEACVVETLLPRHAGAFDAVFSSEVIEHLFDVATFLESIHALLKPGGLLVLTTPYHGLIKNITLDLLNYAGHYNPLGQHIRFYDKKSLNMCLTRTGFEPLVWSGYGRPWPYWKSFFVISRRK